MVYQFFGYVTWRFCSKHVFKGPWKVFLLSLRRQNKALARRIQPATEADSIQVQDAVLSTQFRSLLNKAIELKRECDIY